MPSVCQPLVQSSFFSLPFCLINAQACFNLC
nr:MAG TPA: hypothetical protein [Caudoviricetes sp.]